MRPLTDDQATAILTGQTSSQTTADADLASLVADLRLSYRTDSAPQPSAELFAYLDPAYLSQVSGRAPSWPPHGSAATTPFPNRVTPGRRLAGWLAGLSVAWQVSLSATVACAAVASAGTAGALPEPAQHVFDKFVTTMPLLDRLGDTPDRETPAGVPVFHLDPTRTSPGLPIDQPVAPPAEKTKDIDKPRNQELPAAATDDGEQSVDDDEQDEQVLTQKTSTRPESTEQEDSRDEDDRDRSEDSASDSADASDEAADAVHEAFDDAVDETEQTSDDSVDDPAETSNDAVDDPEMVEE